MGITFEAVDRMQRLGLFKGPGTSVLDIGSSNLFSATTAEILRFISSSGITYTSELAKRAERLSMDSPYDPAGASSNKSFVGELFEMAGFKYNAIDIADGYRTTILDLNHQPAPRDFVKAFDVVLNFGTTEHVLNQYNAMKLIHDATKVGGHIVHLLPCSGHFDHGFFTYTPRCFFTLASYNEYEIVQFSFEGPGGSNDLYAPVQDFVTYHPALAAAIPGKATEAGRAIASMDVKDLGMILVLRKLKDRPFSAGLEMSTSVGVIPKSVTSGYMSIAPAVRSRLRALASRLGI